MKWTALNALGGLAWLAGLSVAKGASFPGHDLIGVAGDHQVVVGLSFGLVGLMVLVWSNLGTEA